MRTRQPFATRRGLSSLERSLCRVAAVLFIAPSLGFGESRTIRIFHDVQPKHSGRSHRGAAIL